jgi:hypothetical protein
MAQAHGWHTESAFMRDTFPCPKCRRTLHNSGEVEVAGQTYPVFQCDDCIVKVEMFGEPFDAALTFAVDGAGTPFDPASPGDTLPL